MASKNNWSTIATKFHKPAFIAAAIVVAVLLLSKLDNAAAGGVRRHDEPPTIDFSWSPDGPIRIEEVEGKLRMSDDYGLDFTTYRMHIVELDKTLDLPIPGMTGKVYEPTLHFGLLHDHPKLEKLKELTLQFSISDDRGQETKLEVKMPMRQ